MSTGNFYNKNASGYFVGVCENEYDYDDHRINVNGDIENHPEGFPMVEAWSGNDSLLLSALSTQKEWYGCRAVVTVRAVLRSGYYAHCNFDWELDVEVEGSDWDSIPEITEIKHALDYALTDKRAAQVTFWMLDWIEANVERLTTEMEEIFERYTEKYQVAYRFSNGETGYKKVS